jgi:outer membrane protein OmpA-like peptidoglycan-associated protein
MTFPTATSVRSSKLPRRESFSPTARHCAEIQADARGRAWTAPVQQQPDEGQPRSRLTHDLRQVRIHADAEAKRLVEEEHSHAFVSNGEIWIDPSHLRPDTKAGRQLLAHELAHVEQQQSGQAPEPIQRQEKKQQPKLGLGSTPPDIDFTRAEGPANEQEHVLFAYDSDKLSAANRKKIESWAKSQSIPVIVELHGFASHEGPDEYNLNLSAHRAAAVKSAIEAALPLGSRVEVIAHGETGSFETPDENRRVGMTSRMKPLELNVPPLGQGGAGQRFPPPSFGAAQQPFFRPPASPLRPSLFPPPQGEPQAPKIDLGAMPPSPYVPRYPQWTAPELYRFPGGAEPEPYWPELSAPFNERGLSMGKGDAEVMRRLATQNLGLLNLTEGLYGGPYNWARHTFPFLDLDPLDVAKPQWAASMAGAAAGAQLTRDNPTPLEAFNREGLKYGLPEPTMLPPLSLSFDLNSKAVKQSQEAARKREEEAQKKKENQ